MNKRLQDSIRACQAGKRADFRVIYESFANYVYTICMRYEVPKEDRKDVMQEIFAEVYVSLKRYKFEKGDFRFWLRSIAVRTVFAYWRKQKKKQFQLVGLEHIEAEKWSVNLDTRDLDKEYLIQEINQLPRGYRTVLNLFVIDGYSHKEIAELLKIKESTSRSQLARAIRQLKLMLRKYNIYEAI